MAAARSLEDRPFPTDSFDTSLVTPFGDSDNVQAIYTRCLEWLMAAYLPPASKIRMARQLDPAIKDETADILMKTRFLPHSISAGGPELLARLAPTLVGSEPQRFFVINADSRVIELIQNPIRCLQDLIIRAMPNAESLGAMARKTKQETGGAPTIFHQPYTDGPLPALIEAMCFYVHGLTLGPIGAETRSGIYNGFRSVDVVGKPPVNQVQFEVARSSCKVMFDMIRT